MPKNDKYLKLCSSDQDVFIKPDQTEFELSIGDIVVDKNNICWEVSDVDDTTPISTSYNDWGNFVLYENGDCNDCLVENGSLQPIYPFYYEMKYCDSQLICYTECDTTSKTTYECPTPINAVFPLTVECVPTPPSKYSLTDGSVDLVINGGTKPYSVVWTLLNGKKINGQLLENVGAGEYTAEVTDLYKDFTETITCTLDQPFDVTVCFAYEKNDLCNKNNEVINELVRSEGSFNNRPFFIIGDGYVIWNNIQNRWEYRTEKGGGVLLSYLPTTNIIPVPFNNEKWVNVFESFKKIVLSSEECLKTDICLFPGVEVSVKYTEAVGIDGKSEGINVNTGPTELNFINLKPNCVINNNLSYIILQFLIYFRTQTNTWVISSLEDREKIFAELDNNSYYLPIQTVNSTKYDWTINDNQEANPFDQTISTVLSQNNTCPTFTNYDFLCIRINCDVPIRMDFQGYDDNGNPYWSDNSANRIDYLDNRWVFRSTIKQYRNLVIISNSTSKPPTDGWIQQGGNSKIVVNSGFCDDNFQYNIIPSNTSCANSSDGSIKVELTCSIPQTQYLFSYDGGRTFETSNVKDKLLAGTYDVQIKSPNGTIKQDRAVINNGPNIENYSIEIVKGVTNFQTGKNINNNLVNQTQLITNFEIIVKNSSGVRVTTLDPSVTLKFDLLIEDAFTLYGPNSPTPANLYEIKLNNVIINPIQSSTSPVTTQNNAQGCNSTNTVVTYSTSKKYQITLNGNFSLLGRVDNIQSNIVATDPKCLNSNTMENQTSVKLTNVSKTCNCCNVTSGTEINWVGCDDNCNAQLPQPVSCCSPTIQGIFRNECKLIFQIKIA